MFLNPRFMFFVYSFILVLSFYYGETITTDEESFVKDYTQNGETISQFVDGLGKDQQVNYCAKALKVAGFLANVKETSKVSVDIFSPPHGSEIKSKFYKDPYGSGFTVYPTQCSIKGQNTSQNDDTRVFFDFSSDPRKIYLFKIIGEWDFEYKQTAQID